MWEALPLFDNGSAGRGRFGHPEWADIIVKENVIIIEASTRSRN